MRWLFLFVLSLNLAYIGLEMGASSTVGDVDVPALKNAKTIVLLRELKQQSDTAEAGQVEEVVVIVDDVSAELPSVEQVNSKDEIGAQVPVAPRQLAEDEPATMPEPAERPNAERVIAKTVASEETTESLPGPPIEIVQSASCFTLGPFRDLAELRGLIREIKSYVIEADFRGREEKERTIYWVYVKPEKNRHQAMATGQRLKSRKIKDFYVIRDGEKINGLSLGHFRSKKGAYGLAKKVKKLGFDVIVEPVYRTYTLYWLDYQLAAGANMPESIFEKYTRSTKKQKISRLSRDCGVLH